jgi:hypothetical protein
MTVLGAAEYVASGMLLQPLFIAVMALACIHHRSNDALITFGVCCQHSCSCTQRNQHFDSAATEMTFADELNCWRTTSQSSSEALVWSVLSQQLYYGAGALHVRSSQTLNPCLGGLRSGPEKCGNRITNMTTNIQRVPTACGCCLVQVGSATQVHAGSRACGLCEALDLAQNTDMEELQSG